MKPVRVLVVEDSPFQRLRIAEALREVAGVTVVETAASGEEAIRKLLTSRYDLMTLDLGLPGMDGHAVLRWVMANQPLPVVVVSGNKQEKEALAALEAGAFDVIGKAGAQPDGVTRWRRRLADAVEAARETSIDSLLRRLRPAAKPGDHAGAARRPPVEQPFPSAALPSAVVVTASTGGPPALRDLLVATAPLNAVVAIAQHMPAPFTRSLAARLSLTTGWDVREAVDGVTALPGVAWLAPGGHHLQLERLGAGLRLRVTAHTGQGRWCPSGDLLFRSAAAALGPRVIGIVLTGMGDDGTAGAAEIRRVGGLVICEGRETAVIPGMPDSAARAVPDALRLPLAAIGLQVGRSLQEL